MIIGIWEVHKNGYVHCDIKPANLMFIEKDDRTTIQYIDFGLAQKISQNLKEIVRPRGTPNYMSRNTHKGMKITRRDDLESIMYIAIIMVNAYLPWFNLNHGEDKDINEVLLEMKEKYWGPKLCEGLPTVFQDFVKIITALKPEDEPPYQKIIDLMLRVETEKGVQTLQIDDIYQLDWNHHYTKGDFKMFEHITSSRMKLGRFRYQTDE